MPAQDPARKADLASLARLTTPALLSEKLSQLRKARHKREIDWKLNLAFLRGDQYAYYNKHADRIDRVPTEESEKPRHRVRIVSNQIQPGVESRIAKLTKTKPVFSATPGSGTESDFKAAQMAERLLDFFWEEFDLNAKRDEALRWAQTAQGYWKITWDPHAGKAFRVMLDPEGRPVPEPLQDLYRVQLEQMGLKPMEQVVYLGDIKVEVMSGFDVYLDPRAKTYEDAKYAICVHYLDPDEIKARWGVQVAPDTVPSEPETSLPIYHEDQPEPTVKRVYVGYFLPTPALPNGRYVVWIDGHEKPLEDGPWGQYFPFNLIPLVKFPGIPMPGSVYDEPVVTQVRPLQKEFNRTTSQILEFKNLTVRPQWLAPAGSMRQRMTTEPGAIWEYIPNQGLKPEPMQMGNLPPYVFESLNDLAARIRDQFGLAEVTEGAVPPNVEAGVAIDLLQEMATDRLAPTVLLIEKSLARAGQIMLQLAQTYYSEERQLKIKGAGGAVHVQKFTQADLSAGIDIRVQAGSGLPRTRAGRQAQILRMAELQLISPHTALKHLDVADLEGVSAMIRADEEKASREHEKLLRGIPLNPSAVQRMMGAVQQGINPQTGEPIQSMGEAQQLLLMASVEPGPLDNHAQHMEVHGLHVKSVEFESYPPDVQERFLMHAQLHAQAGEQAPPPSEPRVSLNLRGTVGPTAASRFLERSGIEVSPDEMAEPPLETSVYDSVDKPDADGAGNDPYTGEEKAQQAELAAVKAAGEEERAQERHEVEMERMRADAQFARKRASQGPPRPTAGSDRGGRRGRG